MEFVAYIKKESEKCPHGRLTLFYGPTNSGKITLVRLLQEAAVEYNQGIYKSRLGTKGYNYDIRVLFQDAVKKLKEEGKFI